MEFLLIIAVIDGMLVAKRLVSRRPRKVTVWSIILGIIYGFLAAVTIISPVSLLLGAVIVFGPIVLWFFRVILFGTRYTQVTK